MRDLANLTHECPKWIVLDGDIDPMWIESLNTVMDDNKVLTLASNERISLTPSMRLLFEISHLKTATPATVSRAGILYINPGDLGWNPYVHSLQPMLSIVMSDITIVFWNWMWYTRFGLPSPITGLFDRFFQAYQLSVFSSFKPISQLRFDYDMITIRRYHDAFNYNESDRNYDMRSIGLRYDYDEKLTCSFLLASNGSCRRAQYVVVGS